jgi:hypothetical protein
MLFFFGRTFITTGHHRLHVLIDDITRGGHLEKPRALLYNNTHIINTNKK